MKQALFIAVLTVLLAAPASAQEKKKGIQCWTNDQGQRMCGDRVPPEYAGKERKVMDERGVVVETRRGAKTPEEIAEEELKAKAAEEAKKQADYDRGLLENFRSTKDLEMMRDERLSLLDSRITASKKSLSDNEGSLKGLQERADALAKAEKPVDGKLEKQIKQFTNAVTSNQKALERYQGERAEIQTKFDGDIARYNVLRPPPPAKNPRK